jgi:hypothetical protein
MTPETRRGINNSVEFIRLCIKLEIIKELYYDARPNKSQDVCRYDSQCHVVLLLSPIPEQSEWILTCQWSLTMCGLLMVLRVLVNSILFNQECS